MPRKVFTAGEVLAAADVNSFLMDQTIMTFAGTAARGSAIGTATEGMYAHLNDTDTLTYWNGSAWVNRIPASTSAVLQVLSTAKTDTFTTSSTSYTGITGLTRSITPSSATSKVLVTVQLSFGFVESASANWGSFRLSGGNAGTYKGASPGSRRDAVFGGHLDTATLAPALFSGSIVYLDSPATTSAITYGVECITRTGGTIHINRSGKDLNEDIFTRGASSITVMEIAA
jgi:hypothetical protein